jgi:hypothetical protein
VEEASLMKKQLVSAPALGLNHLVVYVKLTKRELNQRFGDYE